jgi:large subunit ribosomal protein L24
MAANRNKAKIKTGDTVKVVAGKDKGRTGRVLRVLREKRRVVVEGVHRVQRRQKPQGDQPGGTVAKELPVDISNVALWNDEESRRVKVGYAVIDGKKVRVDRKTGNPLDEA